MSAKYKAKHKGRVEGGRPVMRPDFYTAARALEGEEVELTICKVRNRRSGQQNAYYWAVIIPMIAGEIGIDNESTHAALLLEHSMQRFVNKNDMTFVQIKRTSSMSSAEMEEYNSRVRQWAGEFLNLYIPLPNEIDF